MPITSGNSTFAATMVRSVARRLARSADPGAYSRTGSLRASVEAVPNAAFM